MRIIFTPPANRLRQTVRELLREGLMQNALALWCVQGLRKTLPLILLPYLARVLGPSGWGLVAVFQSFAASIVLFIEFGFGLSGTREVARSRNSKAHLSELFAGVVGAQAVLGICVAASIACVRFWVPVLNKNPLLVCIAVVIALAEGCNPTWFFVGVERMGIIAALEISSKTVATLLIFAFVRSANDVWLALALQGSAPVLSLTVSLCLIYRNVPFRLPSKRLVKKALSAAWSMFLIRSAQSLYTMGNAFLLGMFAGPTIAGYFAGPEKISRALSGLFNPIRETLYPRLSKLIHASPLQAARLARLGLIITSTGGLVIGLTIFFSAPLIIRILLGQQFGQAVPVLRVFSILPPLIAITQSIGVQWLLPLGKERLIGRIVLLAGVLNLFLAMLLVPRFAEIGMAWAVVSAETFVCLAVVCAGAMDRTRRFPFFGTLRAAPVDSVSAQEPVVPAEAMHS
ncbi:MAG: flippase [Acidobacteriaceae bacterium]|nr:flippase [Acidobacteriaceae bacterium]